MGWQRPITTRDQFIVVVSGNSVARGEGATSGHQPSDAISAALSSSRPSSSVFNEAVNGQDIQYFIDNFDAQVDAHRVASKPCLAVMLETAIWIDDTNSALSLANPTAAGQSNYDKHVEWANLAKSRKWLPVVVCAPDLVEPSTYANSTQNGLYRTARDYSYDLMRADTTHSVFFRVIDARARSEFSSPWSLTYYQNAPDSERIHLVDAGYDLLGQIIAAGLP